MKRLFYAMGLMFGLQTFANAATDCNQVTEIPVSECQSLLDLYNNTNSNWWVNKAGWNQTNTPCSWYGTTCSGGHTQAINLSGNNMGGQIPNLNLSNLEFLNLSSNLISGSVPDFNLPNLQSLNLANTMVGTIVQYL